VSLTPGRERRGGKRTLCPRLATRANGPKLGESTSSRNRGPPERPVVGAADPHEVAWARSIPGGILLSSNVRVFTSVDLDHDEDLLELLLAQSQQVSSRFEIVARSAPGEMTERWCERLRREIEQADEVIVICGEHTESSARVSAELRMAQAGKKPYFLLWGRRERMCTKPLGARSDDGMYRWTWDTVQQQVGVAMRSAQPLQVAERYRRV